MAGVKDGERGGGRLDRTSLERAGGRGKGKPELGGLRSAPPLPFRRGSPLCAPPPPKNGWAAAPPPV